MKIKNKLTPYPILFAYNDDYTDSTFETEVNADTQFGEVFVTVKFKLLNEGLQKLISDNTACFAIHIECPSTSFRTKFESYESEVTYKLDSNNLQDKIEVCTFIVAKKDIISYSNEKFHSDYNEYTFDLEKGNILAIGFGKEFTLLKNNDDLENLPSIIKVCKKSDIKNGAISVDTDNPDSILIGIHESIYDLYYSLGKNKFKDTILSLVLLPAIVTVLTRMKFAEEDEKEKKWYKVIENLLNVNNIEVEDLDLQNKEKSILAIAQMIFSDSITRSFKELNTLEARG